MQQTAVPRVPTRPARAAVSKAARPTSKRKFVGLLKPVVPSAELAAIVGAEPVPRFVVTSKVWSYIREHRLQDAANRRLIVCDDRLRAVFGQDRATMFEVPGLLMPHMAG